MKSLVAGFFVLFIAACAHQQQHSRGAETSRNRVSNPAASQPTAGQSAAGTPVAPGSATSEGASRQPINVALVKQGYHAGVRNGALVYCRREQITGSRFRTEVCQTEGQILEEQRAAKDLMTTPHPGHYCAPPDCTS
jgi:hypothetical protein